VRRQTVMTTHWRPSAPVWIHCGMFNRNWRRWWCVHWEFCLWQIAREHRIPFLETSAKSNINVEKAFLDLAQAILNKVCRLW